MSILRQVRAIVARPFLVLLLIVSGATCRDLPTQPDVRTGPDANLAGPGGLSVTPATDTLLVGQSIILTARNANGTALSKPATWTSSDSGIASVISVSATTARVTAHGVGTVTITARSQNKSGDATIGVDLVPVRSIQVTPDSVSLQRGDSVQFLASPRDSAGNALSGRTMTWTSDDTTVATVSASGQGYARARGATLLRVTSEGVVQVLPFVVRVAELAVTGLGAADSANTGDTLLVTYTARNLLDAPNADSVIVRVGLRHGLTNTVSTAVRRALPRLQGGAVLPDSVRIIVGTAAPTGSYSVVAAIDCADASGQSDAQRLAACLTDPATAGSIAEPDEADNTVSKALVVRGPQITATGLTTPDSLLTRTGATITLAIANAGSSTGTAFDAVAGVYDVTAQQFVTASAVTTTALGSRESRAVDIALVLPALHSADHVYEVRAYADCRGSGSTAIERLASCFASAVNPGDVLELNESDNSAARAIALASNVERIGVTPDSVAFTALGDSVVLTATAYDRAGVAVNGVTFRYTEVGSPVIEDLGPVVRADAVGIRRIAVSAEGRTAIVHVSTMQAAHHVVVAPDAVALTALGQTAQLRGTLHDPNGNAIPGATFEWTSLAPQVATVSATGLVTATGIGGAQVVVSSGALADTASVAVAQVATTMAITPDSAVLVAIDDTISLAATAYDANNAPVAGITFNWLSLDEGVATMVGNRVRATGDGTARIVAQASAGGLADTVRIHVVRLASALRLLPDTLSFHSLGQADALVATVVDRNGYPVSGGEVAWIALDTVVVSVDAGGVVVARANGVTQVVAAAGALRDTAHAIVSQRVTRVAITPAEALFVSFDDTVTFTAAAYDAGNSLVSGAQVTWATSDSGVVRMISPARFVSLGNGTAVVRASVLGSDAYAESNVMVDQAVYRTDYLPDTLVLAVGATGQLTARSYDANGFQVTRPQQWSVYEDGTVTVGLETGIVTALAPGVARLVATTGGRLPMVQDDTAIVIVERRLASIAIAPDTALVVLGASVTLTATAVDGSGAPMASSVSWASLDAGIATVNQSGVVSGVTAGSARIVAIAESFADTATVFVNPVGLSHRWLGSTTGGWNDPANWYPATVPTQTNGVYVAAGTAPARLINGETAIAGAVTVAQGATIDATAGELRTHGSVEAPGLIAGRLSMYGSGTLRGTVDQAEIHGAVTLAGRARSTSFFGVAPTGSFVFNGHTLEAMQLTVVGGFTMNTSGDSLIAHGYLQFNGVQHLTAGTLYLDGGALNVYTNIAGESPVWDVGGSHTVVFAGTSQQYASFILGDTTVNAFQNVAIVNPAGLSLSTSATVGGLLRLANGGKIMGDYNSMLKYRTQLPDIAGGTYEVPISIVAGNITLSRNESLPNGLFIDGGGQLRLGGRTLRLGGLGVYNGRLVMDADADTLDVSGAANFHGQSTLSAGAMILRGDLNVSSGPFGSAIWRPSGTHTTVFAGTMPQSFMLGDTLDAQFNDVEVRNTTGVSQMTNATVNGRLRFTPGGRLSSQNYAMLKVTSRLPEIGQGIYEVPVTLIAGDVTATSNETIPGSVFVDGGGHLRLNGRSVRVGTFGTYVGSITMDTPADTLTVDQYTSFHGVANMSAGALVLRGDLNVGTGGSAIQSAWNLSGSHKIIFAGTAQQGIFMSDTLVAKLHHADILNGQGVNLAYNTKVTGLVRLLSGGRLMAGGSSLVRYYNQLPDISGGVYEVPITIVAGNITATRNETFPTGLFVQDGGNLTLGGRRIEIENFGSYDGTLTMNNATDSLVVRSFATFYGTSALSAGTLVLRGDMMINSGPGGVASSFHAAAAHTTVFAGSMPQNLAMASDGQSYFGNLAIDNAAGVQMYDSLSLTGQLLGNGGVLRAQNGSGRLKIAGGLSVNALTLDGVALEVDGGTLTRFDNVTFQNVFAPAQLRLRHAGTAQPFAMNNISFLSEAQGFSWIDATDTNPGTPPLTLTVRSAQAATGPANTVVSGGAVVNWLSP